MRNHPMQNRNDGSAGMTRASHDCVISAAPWSFPTMLVATGHKPRPRWHRVTPL